MNLRDQTVLVVGGGVGGVATALALGRQGFQVQLLEQADQIGAIGYGVQLGPNVMPMLDVLGLADAAQKLSDRPEHILLHDADTGQLISDVPLRTPQFASRYSGHPYLAIHRVDLHRLLLAACQALPNVQLNQSTAIMSYAQDEKGVTLRTQDGATLRGDLVVAADGLRSKLRAQMHPQDAPRDTGYVAHRGLIEMARAPAFAQQLTSVTMWTGDGFHVIYYPLRNASLLNVVLVVRMPAHISASDADAYRAHVLSLVAKGPAQPKVLVDQMDLERRWFIADRNPLRHWHDGRVTLLGDAAHATLQSLAQGAGMALEDAVCLSQALVKNAGNHQAAFEQFHRQRFIRTTRVQLVSRRMWEEFHCGGDAARVRSVEYAERDTQDHYRCLDWLWTAQNFE